MWALRTLPGTPASVKQGRRSPNAHSTLVSRRSRERGPAALLARAERGAGGGGIARVAQPGEPPRDRDVPREAGRRERRADGVTELGEIAAAEGDERVDHLRIGRALDPVVGAGIPREAGDDP